MTLNAKEGGLREVQRVFHLIEETFVGWEDTIRRQTSDANDEFTITRGEFEQINTAIKALPHVMQMLQILTIQADQGKQFADKVQKLLTKELPEKSE
tara:strand:+ start:339 stop:629 length:291 start_codon:yes stop_codon:yes gene_type:complete